jgi:hypothetical protein
MKDIINSPSEQLNDTKKDVYLLAILWEISLNSLLQKIKKILSKNSY